jgi:glycosyltransferase involved in cell wall biosynthesis
MAKKELKNQKKLKIAQICQIIERVPPKKYGGMERVVYWLTEELVNRGHDVTLFASGDSKTSAKLSSVFPRALREMKMDSVYGLNPIVVNHIGTAYQRQHEFDIIHDHTIYRSLPVAQLSKTPVVMTIHDAFTREVKRVYEAHKRPYIVSISNSQKRPAPNLNYIGTVYHGLNMQAYPFRKVNDGYLLFVGRFSPEKAPHIAIEIAQSLNIPLVIAAKYDPERDFTYFKAYIEPKLSDPLIQWVGEVDEEERNKLMSRALCLLYPITWREPFGLTVIESMACGCPVVAFNHGSMPEIIEHGKTGFVVEDSEEMMESIQNIGSIDREYCRQTALSRFSHIRMTDEYEKIYYEILEKKESLK